MKYILFLTVLALILPVYASNYSVQTPDNYRYNPQEGERTLFILDFSNSMNEYLDGARKVDLMLDTMRDIIPKISKTSSVGLRVYGHKMGFTPFEACRASALLVPIGCGNSASLQSALSRPQPKGMTPITYSLKEAVKNDFIGFSGKKHIILLTDGGENCDESPCDYAMELIKTRDDISIDVIAFNIADQEANNQLKCAALATYGKFYTANTAAQLLNSLSKSLNVHTDVQGVIIPH